MDEKLAHPNAMFVRPFVKRKGWAVSRSETWTNGIRHWYPGSYLTRSHWWSFLPRITWASHTEYLSERRNTKAHIGFISLYSVIYRDGQLGYQHKEYMSQSRVRKGNITASAVLVVAERNMAQLRDNNAMTFRCVFTVPRTLDHTPAL